MTYLPQCTASCYDFRVLSFLGNATCKARVSSSGFRLRLCRTVPGWKEEAAVWSRSVGVRNSWWSCFSKACYLQIWADLVQAFYRVQGVYGYITVRCRPGVASSASRA